MDLVEFYNKFDTDSKVERAEYLCKYFSENSLLYSILESNNLLECKIDKVITSNGIEYCINCDDESMMCNLVANFNNKISKFTSKYETILMETRFSDKQIIISFMRL